MRFEQTEQTDRNPAISVIIPLYNAADVIDRSVTCVIENAFQDFELLLVDDGSTDASAEHCRVWQERDERIRVIRLPENRGVSAARNRGLDEARGNYIAFIDADDWVTEDYLGRLYERAETKRSDWVACGAMRRYKDDQTDVGAVCEEQDLSGDGAGEAVEKLIFLIDGKHNLASVVMAIYRRSFLEEHALRFRESAAYGEDTLFNYQASKHVRRFSYIQDPLYIINVTEDSGTVRSYAKDFHRRVQSLLYELNEVRKEEGDDWTKGMLQYVFNRIMLVITCEAPQLSRKERRKAYQELDEFLWKEIPEVWSRILERPTRDRMTKLFYSLLKNRHYEAAFRMSDLYEKKEKLKRKLYQARKPSRKKQAATQEDK